MSFHRIVLGIVGSSVLFSFLAMPTICSQEQTGDVLRLTLKCTTTIQVLDTGVDQPDAPVCENARVKFEANGHDFYVFFKQACPFAPDCKHINTQNPITGPMKHVSSFTIFDYGIVIDGKSFDPHIIGGGS